MTITPLIVANWKMNPPTLAQAKELFSLVEQGIKDIKNIETVICPPFIYMCSFRSQAPNVKLGAQDCFWEKKGAFTGEVSAPQLKQLGCEYVILGHSERRQNLAENDGMINKKIKTVLKTGLKPILCVGDTRPQDKKDFKEISRQLKADLKDIGPEELNRVVIVYEPVWAISTTKDARPAGPQEALEGADCIRGALSELYGDSAARQTKILYGGSVNSVNVHGFVVENKISGVLVGGESLKAEEFIKIVKAAA